MPPISRNGSMTSAITTMPRPPNHCSMARQRRTPGGRSSRPVNTEAPVGVSPDAASKNASV